MCLYKTKGNIHIYLYMGNQIKTTLDLENHKGEFKLLDL